MTKFSKKYILLSLTTILLLSITIRTAPASMGDTKQVGYAELLITDDATLVSIAHNPNVTDYSDEDEVSTLVNRTLQQLNPNDPQNPLSNLVTPGDTVVLKPNLVSAGGIAREGCTRTSVLRPIINLAVTAGASSVIIAEGPASPNLNDEVFVSANIDDLVNEMQIKYPNVSISYQNINKDNWTWVNLGPHSTFHGEYTAQELYSLYEIRMDHNSYYYATDSQGHDPKGYTPGLYTISNTILNADVLINVPKMKVHQITGVTMSLKNLIGITVSDTGNGTNQETIKDIPHWNTSYAHGGEEKERIDTFENDIIWRVDADLHKIAFYADKNGTLQSTTQRKYLSVVDGIIGMEGPIVYDSTPDPHPTGVIVAGQDPVAVDIAGSRVMGFNYSVLYSLTNMEKVTDHIFGTTNTSKICVLGMPLNEEVFGESYVPHINYEDGNITPYKIRLEQFNPPEMDVITTYPEIPWEGEETKIIAHVSNISLAAAGWLRYSLNGSELMIMKMTIEGDTLEGNLGFLGNATEVVYHVCVQDFFLNTDWSGIKEAVVIPEFPVSVFILLFILLTLIVVIAGVYGVSEPDPRYNPNLNIKSDGVPTSST